VNTLIIPVLLGCGFLTSDSTTQNSPKLPLDRLGRHFPGFSAEAKVIRNGLKDEGRLIVSPAGSIKVETLTKLHGGRCRKILADTVFLAFGIHQLRTDPFGPICEFRGDQLVSVVQTRKNLVCKWTILQHQLSPSGRMLPGKIVFQSWHRHLGQTVEHEESAVTWQQIGLADFPTEICVRTLSAGCPEPSEIVQITIDNIRLLSPELPLFVRTDKGD
jgi:hypothetical protein